MKFKRFKIKQPKVKDDGSYYSGPSVPSGKILKLAKRLSQSKKLSMKTSEAIIRRMIASKKAKKYAIPTGVIVWPFYYIGTYKVLMKTIKVKCGPLRLVKWRSVGCDCYAGLKGRRCWHQDYTDYAMDGFSIYPKKYARYPKSFVDKFLGKGK